MTPDKLAKLREVAEKAMRYEFPSKTFLREECCQYPSICEHISVFNPSIVLEFLDELDRLRKQVRIYEKALESARNELMGCGEKWAQNAAGMILKALDEGRKVGS